MPFQSKWGKTPGNASSPPQGERIEVRGPRVGAAYDLFERSAGQAEQRLATISVRLGTASEASVPNLEPR